MKIYQRKNIGQKQIKKNNLQAVAAVCLALNHIQDFIGDFLCLFVPWETVVSRVSGRVILIVTYISMIPG
jgi:hypothetical protein